MVSSVDMQTFQCADIRAMNIINLIMNLVKSFMTWNESH